MEKDTVVKVDIVDVLLDEENTAPIIMYGCDGKQFEFDQIAVIPIEEDLFCILKPITKVPGIKDDEAVVFKVVEDGADSFLKVEENELVAIRVFEAYYNMIEKEVMKNEHEEILSIIKNDSNMQNVYDEDTKERIEYEKMDIHPFSYRNELFAIIKKSPEEDFCEALVWRVVDSENGKRLAWVENEILEEEIIRAYLRRNKNV